MALQAVPMMTKTVTFLDLAFGKANLQYTRGRRYDPNRSGIYDSWLPGICIGIGSCPTLESVLVSKLDQCWTRYQYRKRDWKPWYRWLLHYTILLKLHSYAVRMEQMNATQVVIGIFDQSSQLGTEETQFMPELSRSLRDKGGWETQSTADRKGSEELSPPFLATTLTYWIQGAHGINGAPWKILIFIL